LSRERAVPILDLLLVADSVPPGLAQAVADAAGGVLNAAPGRVWVRMQALPPAHYAENGVWAPEPPPAFVAVLHAHPPEGDERAAEVLALAEALAPVLQRPIERVHIEYAAAGAGRIAFGGRLVGERGEGSR
jgi:hypothetical protein